MPIHYAPLEEVVREQGLSCLHEEPMSRHTTFQIGGPADRFIAVKTQAQLSMLLQVLSREEIPYFVLGNGSNLLVSDLGIRGAVLSLQGEFKKVERMGSLLCAGAAATLAAVCRFAREQSLSGLEFAYGIPGSVGGAAFMDAGAYGGEMKDVVYRVLHLSPEGIPGEAHGEELAFGYRTSRYSGTKDVITGVEFSLTPGDAKEIETKMEELMCRRKEKQPYEMPSAGSIFKRPEGSFAGTLIEACGLKGCSVGGAQVSEKHAGFIVNTGGATCADVQSLIAQIQKTVYREKGVRLECEVRVTGEL